MASRGGVILSRTISSSVGGAVRTGAANCRTHVVFSRRSLDKHFQLIRLNRALFGSGSDSITVRILLFLYIADMLFWLDSYFVFRTHVFLFFWISSIRVDKHPKDKVDIMDLVVLVLRIMPRRRLMHLHRYVKRWLPLPMMLKRYVKRWLN